MDGKVKHVDKDVDGGAGKMPKQIPPERRPVTAYLPVLLLLFLPLAIAATYWIPRWYRWQAIQRNRVESSQRDFENASPSDWCGWLRDPDMSVRERALRHYAERVSEIDDEVVEGVIPCLNEGPLVFTATQVLGKASFVAYAAVEPLVALAESNPGPVRLAAIKALLEIDPIRVCEMNVDVQADLVHAMREGPVTTRSFATHCLSVVGRKQQAAVLNALALASVDENRDLAKCATFALYRLGSDVSVAAILAKLKESKTGDGSVPPTDANGVIRSDRILTGYELWALAQAGEAARPAAFSIARTLREATQATLPDAATDALAAYALARLGPFAAPYLVDAFANAYVEVNSPTAFVLDAWQEEAVSCFAESVRNGDFEQKMAAVVFLEYLGPRAASATAVLAEALPAKELLGRRVLAALRAIGPSAATALSDLERRSESERDEVMLMEIAATIYVISPTDDHFKKFWFLLEEGLKKPDSSPERGSAWFLLTSVRPRYGASLLDLLEHSTDESLHGDLVLALREQLPGEPALLPRLSPLLSHPREIVRRSAANVAAKAGPAAKDMTNSLIAMLNHPQSEQEFEAAILALATVARDEYAGPAVDALFANRHADRPVSTIDFAIRSIFVNNQLEKDLADRCRAVLPSTVTDKNLHFRPLRDLMDGSDRKASGVNQVTGNQLSKAALVKLRQDLGWTREDQLDEYWREVASGADADDFDWARNGQLDAIRRVMELGPEARNAVPLLHSVLVNSHDHELAQDGVLRAIWRITRSPLVVNLMIDCGFVSLDAIQELSTQDVVDLLPFLLGEGSDEAWLALPLAGTAAQAALPELRTAINYGDNRHAAVASLSAYRISPDPALITRLISRLDKNRSYDGGREYVAWSLGQIGPAAQAAIPRLAHAAFEDYGRVSTAAAEAIRRIQPGAVDQWGVGHVTQNSESNRQDADGE